MTFSKATTLGALFSVALASSALAHAHLQTAVPAANATVQAAPAGLTLNFSEGLELKLSGVKVTGPGGGAVSTGTPALSPTDDKVMTVPLAGPLAPGAYTVEWHAVAKDTHATHGTYTFTVKP
jgi:copper resistance protein C